MAKPLADKFRPSKLSQVIGQSHLIGENKPLSILEKGTPQSIILWGSPGSGKTTIANILIEAWGTQSVKFSAVLSGVKEIREALEIADLRKSGLFDQPLVLFVDEIHRFNKAQQDAFLHHLEEGSLILIGATTENPSFALNNALLSRVSVYVLNSLNDDSLLQILDNALTSLDNRLELSKEVKDVLIQNADGDARKLLNLLDYLLNLGERSIDHDKLQQVLPNMLKRFDKGGEDFYNQISALHKSVRGSDPNASLYWLLRMLRSGMDPLYLGRRILRMAWEDIGFANLKAINVVNDALLTYERLGSPEGELALASAVIYLASSPKSNSAYLAYNQACEFVDKDISSEVPIHLRNAPTKLMQELGYGKEYRYAHDYPEHYVPNENYWPERLNAQKFYTPGRLGDENELSQYLDKLRKLDQESQK